MTFNGDVQYFQVTNNLVHDNNNIGIDAIGFEQVSHVLFTDQACDGLISGNQIYNISSATNPAYGGDRSADGLYVDGGTRIVIDGNLVHHCDIGLELASEHFGDTTSSVTARNNVIYDSKVVGVTIGGYDANRGGTTNCTIVNNTLYNNDRQQSGSGEFQIQYHATNNLFENNILDANAQGLLVNSFVKSSAPPAQMNHNLYFASGGVANEQWIWAGVSYTDFPTYVKKTGDDAASLAANPLFLGASQADFHIAKTSPAVNNGTLLGSLTVGTLDFFGSPRVQSTGLDIGAVEH